MDVTATLQRPEIQAIVNKITSVPSRTNHCLAFWVNTNISENVSNRPRPTPPPDHDDMATFQAPLVISQPTDYYSALSAALFHSPKGAPALRELCASYLLTQTGHTSASAPQQVHCQENQLSSEAQPGADPQPRSSAPPGSAAAALQLGVSSESPRAAPPPPSPRPPTLTLTTAEHVTITRGETRLVKFVCSSPITAPSLIAVDNEIQDGLQPVECLVGPSSDRVPVVNLSDADVELEPGRLLGRIPPENFNITIPTVTRVTARNKLPARPAPESVSNVNSTPVVEFDVNPALPAEQQEQLRQLLSDFEDIFHRPGEPIACTNILEAELQLHDQTLYYIPQYKLTPQQLKAAEEEVASLLQFGTATPAGERQRYRVVLDARPVNRRLKEYNFRGTPSATYRETLQHHD
ncbi:Retrovirus-related Pol polyprotein from transposon 412 [Frankliniella fusca]|uniref:Retrovirus-related Pol polyprotein from transposon 412 n=1 Tax=Frankliniella fusca TaxID=407009 RepID=A0AAE1I4N1_9NEOP|nr:Retrovirus-related Pol polyprotein from transposon 412 [Frankliniella fusca]